MIQQTATTMAAPEVDVTIEHDVFTGANNPQQLERFRDMALGMFIHWSIDSQLGLEISHPMVGASERIFSQYRDFLMPKFNPRAFDPQQYAELAAIAGMKYFSFTTKHHSGFCMFHTETTSFNVKNTPFKHDMTKLFVDAFGDCGVGCGLYFSPLDFWWLHENSIPLRFLHPTVIPANNPGLMAYNKQQLTELLTHYGNVDALFFDGPPEGLKELAWALQPELVVTRGEMKTPEQTLPEDAIDGAWETCHTLGGQWNWHPQMLADKTARQLVEMLIETRAKGGNLLLNVTPAPDGSVPKEQDYLLRELGLWLFWHGPAIYEVRPYKTVSEPMINGGRIWYTRSKDHKTIYAFLVDDESYDRGSRREFLLRAVAGEKIAAVELLGQNGQILEHSPDDLDVTTHWTATVDGLQVSALRALRPCGSTRYEFPYVLKISLA